MTKRTPPNKNKNKIFYIHLRYKEDDGSISNHGGITIAYREKEDNNKIMEVAIARCNLIDNFHKRVGRQIAEGNLNFYTFWEVNKPETEDRQEIHKVVMKFVQHKLMEVIQNHRTIH